MNLGAILASGLIATIVLTTTLAGCQWLGYSRMSLPFVLGTMLTSNHDHARVVGMAFHFFNGLVFALVYGLAFELIGAATVWIGAIGGLVHGSFALLIILPLVPTFHPRMATERAGPRSTSVLEPPGLFGLNYGAATPIVAVVAHLCYGAVLGLLVGAGPT